MRIKPAALQLFDIWSHLVNLRNGVSQDTALENLLHFIEAKTWCMYECVSFGV
jgi:hypothetical protein